MDRADLEHWRPKDVARLLALVEGQRRYFQDIVAALPVGVLVLSSAREIVLANDAVRRLFRFPEQGALNVRIDEVLPGWLLVRVEQALKTGAAESNILVDAGPGRLRVGIIAIAAWESESTKEALLIIEDLTGTTGASGMVQNDTAPVPVQGVGSANLSASGLSEQVPAVFWAVEPRTMRPLFVSPQTEQLMGFSPNFLTSNPSFWLDRVHPVDRERVTQFYQSAIQSGSESACEFRSVRSDGQVIWLRETVRSVKDGRRPVYLAGITVDVSQRRLLEAQLVQGERMEAVQKLASRMAHDLNNMLMILQGNAEEVLEALPPGNELRAEMEAVLAAARRITGLTGHLLAFSRRPPLPAEAMDLEPVLSAAAERLNLKRRGGPVRGRVSANAGALDQVLDAVAGAVRKGAQAASVVTLETEPAEIREELQRDNAPLQAGSYTAITITTSDGKPQPEIGAAAFERILPEKDATDDSGARLAQAYSMVRQWGGDMSVVAHAGEPPVFRVFLRRADGASNAQPTGSDPGGRATARQTATILLVEDEEGIRALVEKFLRKHGYEVLQASNGEQALAAVRERRGPIDLLITDMMMPQLGGRELVDRLQQFGHTLKILYISGYTDDATVYAAELPPGSDFLQKPFTLSALLQKVEALLGA